MTPKQRRIDFLNRLVARMLDANADLVRQYGSGVRPGWVSCDEALNLTSAQQAEAEIKALEPLSDDTAKVVTITSHSAERLAQRVEEEIRQSGYLGLQVRRETFTRINGVFTATIQYREASDVGGV